MHVGSSKRHGLSSVVLRCQHGGHCYKAALLLYVYAGNILWLACLPACADDRHCVVLLPACLKPALYAPCSKKHVKICKSISVIIAQLGDYYSLFQQDNKCSVCPETSIPEIENLKAQLPFPREDYSFPRSDSC